jgi:hypothetical protein
MALQPPSGPRLPHYRGLTITLRHTTIWKNFSVRVINPTQRPLPFNSQEAKILAPGGIRNRNPSKRAAADPRLTISYMITNILDL